MICFVFFMLHKILLVDAIKDSVVEIRFSVYSSLPFSICFVFELLY